MSQANVPSSSSLPPGMQLRLAAVRALCVALWDVSALSPIPWCCCQLAISLALLYQMEAFFRFLLPWCLAFSSVSFLISYIK